MIEEYEKDLLEEYQERIDVYKESPEEALNDVSSAHVPLEYYELKKVAARLGFHQELDRLSLLEDENNDEENKIEKQKGVYNTIKTRIFLYNKRFLEKHR